VNHSSVRPNAELRVVATKDSESKAVPRIVMFALEDTPAGDELLLNYGENRPSVIKANPWLRPKGQQPPQPMESLHASSSIFDSGF
jgi:hypothetical protein